MKIHVMSDIHFEHMHKEHGERFAERHSYLLSQSPADVLVLAGDICQMHRHQLFWKTRLEELVSPYQLAIYVPGNHEYYHSDFDTVDAFIQNAGISKLHNLNDGPVTFAGQRVIGGTMWFPENDSGYKDGMGDFHVINNFEPAVYVRHKKFIESMINFRNNDIVVTHHLPLKQSIDIQYARSPYNPWFLADVEQYLHEANLPKAWIHGHTHSACDYQYKLGLSEMRVYCNPAGYPGEDDNLRFWDRVSIDI